MAYRFRVLLDREPAEPEIEALGGVCDDAGLSHGNGTGELDFDRAAVSFADAVFSAIADVEGSTRLHVTAVEADPLLSVMDIAERTRSAAARSARPSPWPRFGWHCGRRLRSPMSRTGPPPA